MKIVNTLNAGLFAVEKVERRGGELYARRIERYSEAAKAIIDDVAEYVKR